MKKRVLLLVLIALAAIGIFYVRYKKYDELQHVQTIQDIISYYEVRGLRFDAMECEYWDDGTGDLENVLLQGKRFDEVMEQITPMKISWSNTWYRSKNSADQEMTIHLRMLNGSNCFVWLSFRTPGSLDLWDDRDSEFRQDPQGKIYYPYGKPVNSFAHYRLESELSAQELCSILFR